MKHYIYSDKEITVNMEYSISKLDKVSKDNFFIKIKAQGDFPHHVIEGMVNALKTIQPDNPHLS